MIIQGIGFELSPSHFRGKASDRAIKGIRSENLRVDILIHIDGPDYPVGYVERFLTSGKKPQIVFQLLLIAAKKPSNDSRDDI